VKNKDYCFAINTFSEAKTLIRKSLKNKIKPIIFIKYHLVRGFGTDWIKTLNTLLQKSFKKNTYKLYVDASDDYGLAIELIKVKIQYIKLKNDPKILEKINQIAKKNKVLLNPSFPIVDL